jgi:hypothetical protein
MDKELQSYYEERFSMTASKGWADLIEDAGRMADNIRDIRNANNGEQLAFRKGQIDILDWLLNLREQAKLAYEEIQIDASI